MGPVTWMHGPFGLISLDNSYPEQIFQPGKIFTLVLTILELCSAVAPEAKVHACWVLVCFLLPQYENFHSTKRLFQRLIPCFPALAEARNTLQRSLKLRQAAAPLLNLHQQDSSEFILTDGGTPNPH